MLDLHNRPVYIRYYWLNIGRCKCNIRPSSQLLASAARCSNARCLIIMQRFQSGVCHGILVCRNGFIRSKLVWDIYFLTCAPHPNYV